MCWYCYWGWPEPVAAIYIKAVEQLGGNKTILHFGPSHIVWEDDNFEDESIRWCLDHFSEWDNGDYEYNDKGFAVARESLEALLALPEAVRCVEPEEYGGDHPEKYPPPVGVTMVRVGY